MTTHRRTPLAAKKDDLGDAARATARGAQRATHRGANNPWFRRLARWGYLSKGVVYLLVGVLALAVDVRAGGTTTDQRGALLTLDRGPLGRLLLIGLAVGLGGMTLWSLAQAFLDADHEGTAPKAIVDRVARAAIALSYLGLAVAAGSLGLAAAPAKSSDAQARDGTALLLRSPLGALAVALVGLAALGIALAIAYSKLVRADFQRRLDLTALPQKAQQAMVIAGRAGYGALAAVFAEVGLFLIVAARRHDPREAKGLGGALQALTQQPFGRFLLGTVALGVIAYGLFALAEARYHRMRRV